MSAFNVVRFRVKPGREADFIDYHRTLRPKMPGSRRVAMIKTGDRAYSLIGEWDRFDDIVACRPTMIGLLDGVRDMLEELGPGLGVTDPASGEVVLELQPIR